MSENQKSSNISQGPELVARDEWQAYMTQQNLGRAAVSNVQEPLTVVNHPDADLAFYALNGLISKAIEDPEEEEQVLARLEEAAEAAAGDLIESDEERALQVGRAAMLADPMVQKIIAGRNFDAAYAALNEVLPPLKQTFTKGVQLGVSLGYIPEQVHDRVEPALEQTSIRIIDGALYGFSESSGAYDHTNDGIELRHDLQENGQKFDDVLGHELTHKAAGSTFVKQNGDSEEYARPRGGFSTENVSKEKLLKNDLNEAVTEHVWQGIRTGDFETLDPDKRKDDSKTYYNYRKVLAAFVEHSKGVIQVKTLTNAYFEDTGQGGDVAARRKLAIEIGEAYGPGALQKLDKLLHLAGFVDYEKAQQYLDAAVLLGCIEPVKTDEQGNVLSKGRIAVDEHTKIADLVQRFESQTKQ